MSLQVRLRHTLGERLLELPDRPVDEPVVVGRASAADVQVPSVTVAPRHCVLFVHEGRWAIQPTGAGAATFVNGTEVQGPAFLTIGDVVTLGPEANAPVLEIDPLGAAQGRAGQPAGVVGAPPMQSPVPETVQPARPAYPSEASAVAPAYGYPVPQPAPVAPIPGTAPAWGQAGSPVDAPPAGDGDSIAWPTDAQGPLRYYPRPPRRDSGAGVVVAVLITLLIAGGAGLFLFRRYQQQQAEQVAAVQAALRSAPQTLPGATTRRSDDPSQVPESIFEKMNPRPRPAPRTRPSTQAAPATGPMTAAPTTPDASDLPTIGTVESTEDSTEGPPAATQPDPGADDPAWKQVLAARFTQQRGKAILAFDDYARLHPGQSADKLAEFTDQVLDKAWFERLEQLCKQREELKASIAQTDREVGEETDDAYKKRVLIPLKEKYERRLQGVEEELKNDMKFDAPKAPNLLDDAQVDQLRAQRDPALYAAWKTRTLAYVRRSHGELPWGQ